MTNVSLSPHDLPHTWVTTPLLVIKKRRLPPWRRRLEFLVVALPGVGHMPAPGEDEKEAARVFYVAATRVTQRLVIAVSGNGVFGAQIAATA